MSKGSKYILGVFNDEDVLINAVKSVRGSGVKIEEVYSPFPVHGLSDVMGIKRSWMSIAAFLFGIMGTSLALTMQIGMMYVDWPMIIGGKDHLPIPSFIPVTFELTVLLASFGMVGTFFVTTNLKPWGKPRIYDIRITDDKHVIAIDLEDNKQSEEEIKKVLQSSGAEEINNKTFE